MAMYKWTQDLSVGVSQIDTQHKRLFQVVGDLHQAMKDGKGAEAIGKILGGLLSYTKTHFADEEKVMQQANFPGLADHRKLHEALTEKVADYQNQFESGRIQIVIELSRFLNQWLTSHIKGYDQEYARFMSNRSQPTNA